METIYGVLYYLNKLDFTDKLNDNDLDNLRCVKRILVTESEDYSIPRLTYVLSMVDKIFIAITISDLENLLNKTGTL